MTAAVWLLTASGLALVGIGGYFALARPALLAEDFRFIGGTAPELLRAGPQLSRWLKHVFRVMGGYIASTGVLVMYLANTGLRPGEAGALAVLALVWVISIGLMAVVNVAIDSDFKPPLLALAGAWALGLVLAVLAS